MYLLENCIYKSAEFSGVASIFKRRGGRGVPRETMGGYGTSGNPLATPLAFVLEVFVNSNFEKNWNNS